MRFIPLYSGVGQFGDKVVGAVVAAGQAAGFMVLVFAWKHVFLDEIIPHSAYE